MSRVLCFVALCLLASISIAIAADAPATPSTPATPAAQSKTGVIKSVDEKAKTFTVTLPARPLTFKVDDKTAITLDGKDSTFDAALKADRKVTVTYTRSGDDRTATKAEVTTTPPAK